MKDLFEKSLHFGLGVYGYSRDKVEELVDDMVKRGKIEEDKAKDLVDELVKKGEEERADMENLIRDQVKDIISSDYASKDDIRRIIREELEKVKEENED